MLGQQPIFTDQRTVLGRRDESSLFFSSHLPPALVSSFFSPSICVAETFKCSCGNKIKFSEIWQGATIISAEVLIDWQHTGCEL